MTWDQPRFTKAAFDTAGAAIASDTSTETVDDSRRVGALAVVENWRSSHAYPLDAFGRELRSLASTLGAQFTSMERLKRLPSIERKLHLPKIMRLTQLQDIAGCRIVVDDEPTVRRLVELCERAPWRHTFKNGKDYIAKPKADGYRGVHRVYRYASGDAAETCYDGMQIEVQLRTAGQHLWSTAVETIDVARGYDLKFGGGPPAWRRFFALVSTVFALRDGEPETPETPASEDDAIDELRDIEQEIDARTTLRACRFALDAAEAAAGVERSYGGTMLYPERLERLKGKHFFLLSLEPESRALDVQGFARIEQSVATQAYEVMERDVAATGSRTMVVLVSVEEARELRKAYPNYFFDTTMFESVLDGMLGRPY